MEISKKLVATVLIAVTAIILIIVTLNSICYKNDDQNWQFVQSVSGDIRIQNDAGWYTAPWATVWTWPKASDTEHFGPVRVTFNDGGNAEIKGVYRFRFPTIVEKQRLMHREFSSNSGNIDDNVNNVDSAIIAHLANCLKNTGPMMSSSEHQSARKGEFYRIVDEQLRHGLYQTKKVLRDLEGQLNEKGEPIKVLATDLVVGANGLPIITEKSPLDNYGIEITQFSITDSDYDDATLKQFASKKEAFLAAENSKAQRESQIQERMMIEERGKKEKAEVEAQANKEKAVAIIKAQQEVEVASAAARKAEETKKRVTIEAESNKAKLVVEAETVRDVSKLRLEASKLDSETTRTIADAESHKISKAGSISEKDRVLAELESTTRIGVAKALAGINVPSTVISGGAQSGSDASLMNLILLRAAGIIKPDAPAINR